MNEMRQALNDDDRALCATTASWLRSARALGGLGLLAAAFVMAGLLGASAISLHPVPSILVLLLLPLERYFALRLGFDAGLFAEMAGGGIDSLSGLDRALAALGLRKADAMQRSLEERTRGAMRLWRRHAAVVVLQVLLCWGGWVFVVRP
jgi:hypothetical protein